MRLLLVAVSICLLSSCAGLADSIRKHNQKKQIYQQYSAKYYAACQKEAFNYFPVAIVKREKPQVVTPKPNSSFSCTKWGNTVNCQDTTSGGYEGLIQAATEGVDMLAGKTNTYDANAGARGNHIKSCIDSNLRNDSQFREAILVVENRYSATKAKRSNKKKAQKQKKENPAAQSLI
jgi:opacity protein-like surface antigen